MPRPIIKNIGLRRDRNFSDLTDQNAALTNLLDDFVGGELSYESIDLLTGIEDVHLGLLENTDLQKIASIAFQNSYDLESAGVLIETATPLITIKNQFDKINIDSGDPTYFSGGDGLLARFWNSSEINTSLTSSSNGSDIFIGDPSNSKVFWNNGLFSFNNKLDDSLTSNNGGIQWTGWLMPVQTGRAIMKINTTGFVMVEVENESGSLEVLKNIYQTDRSVTVTNTVSDSNILHVSKSNFALLCEGDTVSYPFNATITDLQYDDINDIYKVYLENNISIDADSEIGVDNSVFVGQTPYSTGTIYLSNLIAYEPRQIRISVWFTDDFDNETKDFDVLYNDGVSSAGSLLYWYIYSEINQYLNPSIYPTFKKFYNNKLLKSGGEIGYTTGTVSTAYKDILTTAPITISYVPKDNLNDITKTTKTYKRVLSTNVLNVTGTSTSTSDVEIGNYAIGNGIPKGTYVTDISIDRFIVLNQNASSSGSSSYRFIDHRGFVDYFSATSSTDTVTIDDTSNLKIGMVVITGASSSYIRITEIVNSTQFKTSSNLGLTGTETIYIYQDRGLINSTLDNFCASISQYELSATAISGATTLELTSIAGLSVGDYIQVSPAITPSSNTQITNINFGLNSVDISNPTSESLGIGSIIIVIPDPSSSPPDKEACAVGLNTAPPFESTDAGLSTSTSSNVDLILNNGKLITSILSANSVTINSIGGDTTYNRKIPLTLNGVSYNILAST